MKIALDAGHGYNTAGKRTPDDIREWTLNDRVLKGFETEIKQYQGVTVLRLDDATGITDVPLVTRTNKAKGCDVLLSFHHNAYQSIWGSHGGSEAWVYQGRKSEDLAKVLLQTTVDTLGLRNRGVKQGNLHINREFAKVSVLMEIGFMDSTTDKIILEEKESLLVGKNMAIAFARYYKLSKEDKPIDKPVEKTIEQMAQEVNRGLHGNGHANRQKSLGVDDNTYAQVRARVNELNGIKKPNTKPPTKPTTPKKSIDDMANEVRAGKHGTGHSNRQKSLGISDSEYAKVRARVNELEGAKTPVNTPKPQLRDGAKVQIKSSAVKYVTDQPIPNRYKGVTYTVLQIKHKTVLIKELMSWVYIKDIVVVG